MNAWKTGMGALLSVALLGCGDSESNPFGQLDSAQNSAIATACGCFAALGHADRGACMAAYQDSYDATERACVEDVYRAYSTELAAGNACRLSALDTGVDCFNDVTACDQTAVQACFQGIVDTFEMCPDPAEQVQEAIDACSP